MNDEEGSPSEEAVRKAVDHAQSGAPAAGSAVRDRFTADEIFQRVVAAAGEEVTLGFRELFFSGLAAGFAIALTFMLHASFAADFGEEAVVASGILYPLRLSSHSRSSRNSDDIWNGGN
ncbi:transporter [Halalkalicoccus jeotgali]|uniref:Putative transporter n=1 Tax=Halalkalicoccus jeotgali (strain DSM 18796 / CECT 7217 / JCM 14584 / KCTC 4019 / B3) TaxID=795797 RepID=L9VV86_HALJB|nr:transporter [Halalkalicoccus jeotgali]ELY40907.1 putative transporter [Halalkalicoccus jeotgali B3]